MVSHSVVSASLWPHGLQHTRLPSPSYSPGVCSNSCPLNQWCHPTIMSSVTLFSSCLQSFPESEFIFNESVLHIRWPKYGASASASVLPTNIHGWFPLGLTDLISLLSKGLPKVFPNITVQKNQLFGTQSSLWSNPHICTWLLENHRFD